MICLVSERLFFIVLCPCGKINWIFMIERKMFLTKSPERNGNFLFSQFSFQSNFQAFLSLLSCRLLFDLLGCENTSRNFSFFSQHRLRFHAIHNLGSGKTIFPRKLKKKTKEAENFLFRSLLPNLMQPRKFPGKLSQFLQFSQRDVSHLLQLPKLDKLFVVDDDTFTESFVRLKCDHEGVSSVLRFPGNFCNFNDLGTFITSAKLFFRNLLEIPTRICVPRTL